MTIFIAMAATGCKDAATQNHILWRVTGETNTVYLLGSVHLLRQDDYPLPLVYERVYDDAESIVMELDMDDLDPLNVQQQMMAAGLISDGRDLHQILGDELWNEAAAAASALDIPIEMLNATEPWLAALTVVELQMMKLGFDSSLGVEFYFLDRARKDKKPIEGFETIEEQIAVFDLLPMEEQSRFLLKTLEDAQTIEEGLNILIEAWRAGDTRTMQQELIKGFDGFPAVYDSLVVRRNRAWTGDIEKLLDDKDDYLIIVGALHLIGNDSVIKQLKDKGYRVDQL